MNSRPPSTEGREAMTTLNVLPSGHVSVHIFPLREACEPQAKPVHDVASPAVPEHADLHREDSPTSIFALLDPVGEESRDRSPPSLVQGTATPFVQTTPPAPEASMDEVVATFSEELPNNFKEEIFTAVAAAARGSPPRSPHASPNSGRRLTRDSLAATSWTSLDSSPPCMSAGEYADSRMEARLQEVRANCEALLLARARTRVPVHSSVVSTERLAPQCDDSQDVTWHNGVHRRRPAHGTDDDFGMPAGSARPVRVPATMAVPPPAYHPAMAMGRVVERYLRQRQERAAYFREAFYTKKAAPGWQVITGANCKAARKFETPAGPAPGWDAGWMVAPPMPLR